RSPLRLQVLGDVLAGGLVFGLGGGGVPVVALRGLSGDLLELGVSLLLRGSGGLCGVGLPGGGAGHQVAQVTQYGTLLLVEEERIHEGPSLSSPLASLRGRGE